MCLYSAAPCIVAPKVNVARHHNLRFGDLNVPTGPNTKAATDRGVSTLSSSPDPGMAVTVEIKIGTRRIISYLLSPLAKYSHDSLRKR